MSATKRYSKQDVIDLVASVKKTLKKRKNNNKGLPWTYIELKSENPDLEDDFAQIQKRIKSVYGVSATEYFTKEGFIFGNDQKYTEAQLKRLCKRFSGKYLKTYKTLLNLSQEFSSYRVYRIEDAIRFIKNTLKMSPTDYFIKGGMLHSNAKKIEELQNNSSFKYEFEDYDLPQTEEVKGFKTECSEISGSSFRPIGIFSNSIFKGFTDDITDLYNFFKKELPYLMPYEIENSGIVNISIVKCVDDYLHPHIEKAIRQFPQLKFIGFYKRSKDSSVFTVYSESGYPYLTEAVFVGNYDYKADSTWVNENSPDDDFTDSYIHINTGEGEKVKYKCPFKAKWNDMNYVKFEKGTVKIVSNKKEALAVSKPQNDLIQKYKYPISFWIYTDSGRTIGTGEKLHFKVKKATRYSYPSLYLLTASGEKIAEIKDLDLGAELFVEDWKNPPFNIPHSCFFDILCEESPMLSADVVACETEGSTRILLKISLE